MRIVISLGGNALGKTPTQQLELARNIAKPIVDLIEKGNEIIITHGNGPQVGMLLLAMETASSTVDRIPEMTFPECGAMSQGYIGYHLQNAIGEELLNRCINKPVATIITQVIVDKCDPAFQNPTKPIGDFYTEEKAKELGEKKGYIMKEDAGRGWRRVVPSPIPIDIVEKKTVQTLVENGHVVITAGGGGIPLVVEENRLVGVPAVIDKDFASEKIAELLDADYLLIFTAVEKVAINFGMPNQKELNKLTIKEAEKYIQEGHFAPGSMLPKIQAAMKFVQSKKDRKVLITVLEKASEGIEGKTGTIVVK